MATWPASVMYGRFRWGDDVSEKVLVTVTRAGAVVESTADERPVHLLPNDVAGVVYRGRVYPLHPGDVIDLTEASYAKDECPRFVRPGSPIPYAPSHSVTDGQATSTGSEQGDGMSGRQADGYGSCDHCGAPLVLRTAKRGPNAGNHFLGCSRWRPGEHHTTRPLEGDFARDVPPTRAGGISAASATAPVKVTWYDAATARATWLSTYTVGGARLRCLPDELHQAVRDDLATCWIAAQDLPSFEPSDEATARVVGMMHKVLKRGTLPFVPPSVEEALLGVAEIQVQDRGPGLVGVAPVHLLDSGQLARSLGWTRQGPVDDRLPLDSDEELLLLREVAAVPGGLDRICAQAPLESLVRGLGGDTSPGSRRVDFLIASHPPVVIEVDGLQHADSGVDDERDSLLASVGVEVVRVAAADVRRDPGIAARLVPPFAAQHDGPHPLVHAPVQAQRLVLALLEGVQRGFLGQGEWSVYVNDPTDFAAVGLPGYLRLLAAIDALWGGGVAPSVVEVQSGDVARAWRREGLQYVPEQPASRDLDLIVNLDLGLSPLHAMPEVDIIVPTVVVRDARLPVALLENSGEPNVRVKPVLPPGETDRALTALLQDVFGFRGFNEGQLPAILEVLHGRDCVALLPTGAGKSLIYQMAGLVLPGRTLVIDPLVSLMEDQVRGLVAQGIDRVQSISLSTSLRGATQSSLEQVATGDSLFVFISPERLQNPNFRRAVRSLAAQTPVNLAVVDEAHCVSEWGHDFRTAYLNIGKTMRRVCRDAHDVPPPLLALTGTASRAVLRDVLTELQITQGGGNSIVKPRTFDRPELQFTIHRTRPSDAVATLEGAIRGLPALFRRSPASFFKPAGQRTMSGLIFVPHVNGDYGTVQIAGRLEAVVGYPVPAYSGQAPKGHQGQWEAEKRYRADQFMGNEATLMVCTKSFGMGIDKPNIRYVVHYGIPGSIESYYQEVGRAGRDRLPAQCILVMSELDEQRNRLLLDEEVDIEEVRGRSREGGRSSADDVTRQLFFHTNSFGGIQSEVQRLAEVLDSLGDRLDIAQAVSLPLDVGENRGQERALHRLALLGLVDDYTIDYGAREVVVFMRAVDGELVRQSFLGFIERSQPGRRPAYEQKIVAEGWEKPRDMILGCGHLLVEFVYDTIERARRRSLREMLLAARESRGDAEFRQRLLDYLQEGDVAPRIEALVDATPFDFRDWLDQLSHIVALDEAQEWRGSTARLLASYPDHPGLLLGRAFSEALLVDGDLDDVASNVVAALRSAGQRYGADSDQNEDTIGTVVGLLSDRGRVESAGVILAACKDALEDAAFDSLVLSLSAAHPESPLAATIALPVKLRPLARLLDDITRMEATV